MSASLEVWLDCDLCRMQRLGTLAHDCGQAATTPFASSVLTVPLRLTASGVGGAFTRRP